MGARRTRVFVAVFSIGTATVAAPLGATAGSEVRIVEAQEVRAVAASDLGIGRPGAIRFDVARGVLIVRGRGAEGSYVAQVGFDENLLDRTDLGLSPARATEPGPSLTAVNPEDGLAYTLAGSTLTGVDDSGTKQVTADLSAITLNRPTGITFAPSSDPTDSSSAFNLFVADAGSETNSGSIVEVSLAAPVTLAAPVDTATLVRDTATSAWTPGSPDPSGVAWLPGQDQLVVVDSEVEETTGAGWHNVNLWRTTRAGVVVGTGTLWGPLAALGGFSKEPTGAGYDSAGDTLFVSDDSAKKVWVIKRGTDGNFGSADDVVTSINASAYGSTDTEDPDYETTTGHLFFLDGTGREIYRINPVDGIFGNGNDTMTQFDISHLGPTDFEGLTSAPGKGTLYVGARTTKQIFEISLTGTLIRTINLSGISGLRFISGLAVAPNSTGSGSMSLYVVDRAIDNGPDPTENDGRLFEVTAPNIGGTQTNQAPVANNDSATTSRDTSVDIDVLANDSDPNGDPLSIVSLTQPSEGSTSVVAGKVRYVPPAGWTGSTSFTYSASDGTLQSGVATVSVTVTQTNQPPTANNDSASTNEDTAVDINVLGNDTDPDGQSLTVQIVSQPANGSVSVNANQTVRFAPNANWFGTTTFTYQAFDGIAPSNVATVTVTVNPVNDAPVANNDTAVTTIGTSVVIDVLANDTDVDGPALSVTALSTPTAGTAQVVAGGVQYTPPAGFTGVATFTYQATDGSLLSNVATVTVTVRDPITTFYATGETTVKGSTTGSYTATFADDNVTEQLKEEVYAGNRKTRLEHRWSFSLTPGSSMSFSIRAHTSGEPFAIAYSTNGGSSWTTLTTISATTETAVTLTVPANLSGSVLVRAIDTNSARGDSFADTLTVDEMWFRSTV